MVIIVKQNNLLIFRFLWNSVWEKLPRKNIYKNILNGGLSISNIRLRSETNLIQLLCKIRNNFKQPWAALSIHWFGSGLKDTYPSLSSNKYVHTLDIPETLNHIKEIILKYKGDKKKNKVWEMNTNHIYSYILESNQIISKVEYENPIINWNKKIWKQIHMTKTQHTIYVYIYIYSSTFMVYYL